MKFLIVRDVKHPKRDSGMDSGYDFFIPEYSEEFKEAFLAKNKQTMFVDQNNDEVQEAGENVRTITRFTIGNDELGYYINVAPQCDVLIPSGVKVNIEDNTLSLDVDNKSGVCTKQKFIVGADIVDFSYEGECHLHIINYGLTNQKVYFGNKVVQLIPRRIDPTPAEVKTLDDTSEEEFFKGHTSNRGAGGFGSTSLTQ